MTVKVFDENKIDQYLEAINNTPNKHLEGGKLHNAIVEAIERVK